MITDATHYLALAAAYARGALAARGVVVRDLADEDAVARGADANLELHRFKRTAQLPRVRAVIGALRGFSPDRLIDLGSGRGAFVWPLLDEMGALELVAVDQLAHRAQLYEHVRRGGIDRVAGVRADITMLPFTDGAAPCVTALEVLEHLPDDGPERAIRETMRVASVAVIASVPAHEDNNPDHVHLFDGRRLEALFRAAGARRVATEHVRGHIIVVATR